MQLIQEATLQFPKGREQSNSATDHFPEGREDSLTATATWIAEKNY
jgi:hypothetical protein